MLAQRLDLRRGLVAVVGHDLLEHANSLLQLFLLRALGRGFVGRPPGDHVELLALQSDNSPSEADAHGCNRNEWSKIHFDIPPSCLAIRCLLKLVDFASELR